MEFATHARLFDSPDPRRIDLGASLRRIPREWLVRASRQTSATALQLMVDVSPSMHFGERASKLHVVADFIDSLGQSAWRSGDALGMTAFDHECRDDLLAPIRTGRGVGHSLAVRIRESQPRRSGLRDDVASRRALESALRTCADHAGIKSKLVFIASDFHWPDEALAMLLKRLQPKTVVPLVIWDRQETRPPERGRWLTTRELESGQRRSLWLRPSIRARWQERVAERKHTLETVFRKHQTRPFFMETGFNAEALSRYFLEHIAA